MGRTDRPPKWVKPQLTRLVEEAPSGDGWLHEIKLDGYRMHGRIDGKDVKLLTRTGLDWSHRYRATIEALGSLKMKSAYLDGELCAFNAEGVPVFSRLQHVIGNGPGFRAQACKLGLEGAISKQADRPYAPGDRGIWVKSKCLNREEFVVVGWTDPEGSRSHIGALLLGYYTDDGRLHYAGRAGTGITDKELKRLAGVLKPLQVPKMPLAEPPPPDSRFGSPLKLSRVHWVRPELVVEVTYLTWTEDNLLRQVSYQGQREDKPAKQVVRSIPHP